MTEFTRLQSLSFEELFSYKNIIHLFNQNLENLVNSSNTIYDKNGTQIFSSEVNSGWIIKKLSLCYFGQDTRHCKSIKRKKVDVFDADKKTKKGFTISIIQVPDFLMELMAQTTINNLLTSNRILGVTGSRYFSMEKNNFYIELQKLVPFDKNILLMSEYNLVLSIFHVMTNIFFLQQTMRLTHYDLILDNLMIQNINGTVLDYGIPEIPNIFVKSQPWLTIKNFSSCVFSDYNENLKWRIQYTNITSDPVQEEFNYYCDGLTFLRDCEKYLINENYSTFVFKSLKKCFCKNDDIFNSLFTQDYSKPNLNLINLHKDDLYKPKDVILNLYKEFYNLLSSQGELKAIENNDLRYNIYRKITNPFGKNEIMPIFKKLPSFSSSSKKLYFMNFEEGADEDSRKINIKVIQEVRMENVFVFSLFAAPAYYVQVYRWFYDQNYIHPSNPNIFGKNAPEAFFRWYLKNQIDRCIELITNRIEGSDIPIIGNQWPDFGTLMLVDKHVLELPMMIQSETSNSMVPWHKTTNTETKYSPEERSLISKSLRNPKKTVSQILEELELGTVKDYILFQVSQKLDNSEIERFGLYKYSLHDSFNKKVLIPVIDEKGKEKRLDFNIYNTTGMLGSLIRFSTLQDPQFNTILFRDAHSTMPNVYYDFDRKWYDTWKNKTNKKLWVYSCPHYMPPHGSAQKISLAAAWGACKRKNEEGVLDRYIFNPEQYNTGFGYIKEDETYFGRTSYGIDERVMLKLTVSDLWLNNSYFVTLGQVFFLVGGQTNPRQYKVFKDNSVNDIHPDYFRRKKGKEEMIQLIDSGIKNIVFENISVQDIIDDNLTDSQRNLVNSVIERGFKIIKNPFSKPGAIESLKRKTFFVVENNDSSFTDPVFERISLGDEIGNKLNIGSLTEFEKLFLRNKPYMCRPLNFRMTDKSFFTDMRCAFLASLDYFAIQYNNLYTNTNVNKYTITFGQYYEILDYILSGRLFEQNLLAKSMIDMIPPRWNLWSCVFDRSFNDPISYNDIIKYNNNDMSPDNKVNLNTVCEINKRMWTSSVFDFDKYIWGTVKDLPERSPLPDDYPIY